MVANFNETLIICDVQPEYEKWMPSYLIRDIVDTFNEWPNNIIIVYNGVSVGQISENDYYIWLENEGFDTEKLKTIEILDKGYGHLRDAMDVAKHQDIIKAIKVLIDSNEGDSRSIDEEKWNKLNLSFDPHQYPIGLSEVVDLLENDNTGYALCGGGKHECLLEVELFLSGMDKKHRRLPRLTY
jgi:hypothetical protein